MAAAAHAYHMARQLIIKKKVEILRENSFISESERYYGPARAARPQHFHGFHGGQTALAESGNPVRVPLYPFKPGLRQEIKRGAKP